MFEDVPASLALALAIAFVPAALHWWRGRALVRLADDPALPERLLANRRRAGAVLGVKYVIVGSITKFGTEQSNKSFGGGGFGSKFGVGEVGTSKGKANVAITARIIDVTTGEIMASAKGDGTSKRSGLLLEGGGGGYGGAGVGKIAFGSSDFHDTIIGEATETAVKATAVKLVAAKARLQ